MEGCSTLQYVEIQGSTPCANQSQVTLGLWLAGVFPLLRAVLLVPAQVAGGIAAAGLVSALFPGPLNVQTKLGDGTTNAQGLFIEMMLTAELVFTILMLAVEKHRASFIAPACIGMTLFMDHLIGNEHILHVIKKPLTFIRNQLHRR